MRTTGGHVRWAWWGVGLGTGAEYALARWAAGRQTSTWGATHAHYNWCPRSQSAGSYPLHTNKALAQVHRLWSGHAERTCTEGQMQRSELCQWMCANIHQARFHACMGGCTVGKAMRNDFQWVTNFLFRCRWERKKTNWRICSSHSRIPDMQSACVCLSPGLLSGLVHLLYQTLSSITPPAFPYLALPCWSASICLQLLWSGVNEHNVLFI